MTANDDSRAPERSKVERRMIRVMTKKGGKGFRILRSAEAPLKQYQRAPGVTPRTVAFPDELWERAQRYADAHEISVSAVVRAALEEFLRRNEK